MLAKLVSNLAREPVSVEALAAHAGFDPALSLAILEAATAANGGQAPASLTAACRCLGVDFLRVLALTARPRDAMQETWAAAIRVAYLARLIAAHTQSCDEEQAWVAGLAHTLADDPRCAEEERLTAWLLAADPAGFVLDAVCHCRASPARVKSAHPLVRVLQLAVSLTYSVHVNGNVGVRASLGGLGLDAAALERLENEAEYLAGEAIHRYSAGEALPGAAGALAEAYAGLARRAALQEYLEHAADAATLAQRAGLLLRALFGVAPVLLARVEGRRLVPLPGWPAPVGLAALALPADLVPSVLSRAAGGTAAYWQAAVGDRFPVVDAQLARLLGAQSLLCEPLALGGQSAVLIAGNAAEDLTELPEWRGFLQALAARAAALQSGVPAQGDSVPRHEVRKAVHEAANPLTIIRNYVNLLAAKFSADHDTRRDLAIIGGEIERVAGILQGLGARHKAPPEAGPPSWVDVNQVISELVRMSLDTLFLPNKVNVGIDLDPGLGSLFLPRDPLKQVLLNLAKNAVEAMPEGGRLGFASARAVHDGRNCALITVADTGPGLPPAVRERLFQPAVSSKGGEHAGLGLYISHSLVTAMGGKIECDSDAGGCRFRIYLPMAKMGENALPGSHGT